MLSFVRVKELKEQTKDCPDVINADIGKTKHIFVRLSTVFEDDDGNTELTFFVPIRFVMEYADYQGMQLEDWLEEEYDSDDSKAIYDKAILENMVFSPKID